MIFAHQSITSLIRELMKYGLVSLAALAVDFSCLLIFSHFIHYLWAATLSFILGGLVAYQLSIKFVFEKRSITQASAELSAFIALGLFGLAINATIIKIGVEYWAWPISASKVMAAGATFSCNFALRKWLLFSKNKKNIEVALCR